MRRLLLIAIVAIVAASAWGFDFGLNVDDGFLYASAGVAEITNSVRAVLWGYVGSPAGPILNARFSFSNLSYALTEEEIPAVPFPYMFDVDELSFGFNHPNGRIVIGRYLLTEPTFAIFTHRVDGLSFRYALPLLTIAADFGYTGLLWKSASAITPSLADVSLSSSDEVVLGSPRVVGLFSIEPSAIFGQRLRIGALVQEDLRDPDLVVAEGEPTKEPGMAGLLDTQYLFLQASGSILPTLFYTGFAAYGAGGSLSYIDDAYRMSNISSLLVGLTTQLYLPALAYSLVGLRFQLGSGDADATAFRESNATGDLNTFVSITGAPSGLVFSPNPGNLFLTELSYSVRPAHASRIGALRTMQLAAKAIVFLRPTTGYISEPGISSESTERYLGSEIDLSVNSRPFSDLGFSFASGIFFPSLAFTPDTGEREAPRISVRATVSLSM